MKSIFQTRTAVATLRSLAALVALVALTGGRAALAQQTPADTVISNTATATYTDGTPTTYSAQSLPVTVTVARVAGLAITPDAGTLPNVVPGQTNVDFSFTVTNASNFDTHVLFLQNRGSITLSGTATITMAVIDGNGDGQVDSNNDGNVDPGDVDIRNNAGNVSYAVARNASFLVLVRVNVGAGAGAGTDVVVTLGDAPANGAGDTTHDNVKPANNSTNEVRTDTTSGAAPVGGEAEARGDAKATVENDAQLRLSINQPLGPVARGSDITYNWTLDNVGLRNATSVTLPVANGPAAAGVGVFVIVPIPQKTVFKNVGVLPPGVTGVLYSTVGGTFNGAGVDTALPDPFLAGVGGPQWSTTAPADPTTVHRVAYNLGASLAASGGSVANIQTVVTVSATADTTTPVYEIGEAFGKNRVNATISDQSGDAIVNQGDGNANFDEPKRYPAPTPPDPATLTQGYQVPTTLLQVGAVFIGPAGAPRAVNTTSDDDFTNLSTSNGINVAPGAGTSLLDSVVFTNTVENAGNANDTFTLTAPAQPGVPANFVVEISTNGGASWTTVSGGGSVTLAVAFGATADIKVRVTAPANSPVLTGYANVIRAASGITPAATNDTIDRLYTGFLLLTKSVRVLDAPGGSVAQPIPGNYIEYKVTYKNIATASVAGNPNLTANNVVITENGNLGSPVGNTNNWASFTDYVATTAVDPGGTVDVTQAAGGILKDTIAQVLPQATGTFTFVVKIR